jgi:predicted RNase H-like HicB family nuclease
MAVRRFRVLLEWDGEAEAWVTFVPALDHLSTFGATREEALANTQEAILGWIEAAEKEGLPVPTGSPALELVDLDVAIA